MTRPIIFRLTDKNGRTKSFRYTEQMNEKEYEEYAIHLDENHKLYFDTWWKWESKKALPLLHLRQSTIAWLAGHVPITPTSLGPPGRETDLIMSQLNELNAIGMLTDDSQPGLFEKHRKQRAYLSGYLPKELADEFMDRMNSESGIICFIPVPVSSTAHPVPGISVTYSIRGNSFAAFTYNLPYRSRIGFQQAYKGVASRPMLDSLAKKVRSIECIDADYGNRSRLFDTAVRIMKRITG